MSAVWFWLARPIAAVVVIGIIGFLFVISIPKDYRK